MKRAKPRTVAAILALTAAAAAGPAIAQDQGWYIGLHIGQVTAQDACQAAGGLPCDDSDAAWRILAGYQIFRGLAFELAYGDGGKVSVSGGGVDVNVEPTLWELVAVGSFPFTANFSAYGKLGTYRADTDVTSNTPLIANESKSNSDLTYGVGVRWDFTKHIAARIEYQVYADIEGAADLTSDAEVISIGLIWMF